MKKQNLFLKKIMAVCIAVILTTQGAWANIAQEIADIIRARTNNDLTATVSGSTVTVTGGITATPSNADYLTFGINSGVIVVWRATLQGSPQSNFSLININGGAGIFRMESGTIENTGTGRAITNNSTSAIYIQGGEVRAGSNTAVHNVSTGIITVSGSTTRINSASSSGSGTIFLASSGTGSAERLIVNGGTIENTATGAAIRNNSVGTVRVSGGAINARGGSAIFSNSNSANTNISSGILSTTSGSTINGGTITISGGTVSTETGTAINTHGETNISGGTVSATTGTAINRPGLAIPPTTPRLITISGNARITSANTSSVGTIDLTPGNTLNVNGGIVENTATGSAISYRWSGAGSATAINVASGTIRATNGIAINSSGNMRNNVTISGGTVSTNGNEMTAINIASGSIRVTGGTISASQSSNIVINTGGNVTVTLGRNPVITGRILANAERLQVITDETDAFAPSAQRIYTLDFPVNQWASGNIAVMDGWEFLSNFRLHNPDFALRRAGLNLVMAPSVTVTFNLNGAPGTSPNPISVAQGGTLPSLPTALSGGRNFNGWFTDSIAGTQVTTSTTINNDMTVWARWSLINYNITYIHNNENNDTTRATFTIASPTIILPTPTKIGYFFDGWFNNANLQGTVFTTIPTGSINDRTFWARWLTAFTITFDARGGAVEPTFGTTGPGGILTAGIPTPTKNGYTFNGWFTDSIAGTQVTTNTAFSSDTTIFARWTLNRYRITFDARDGEVTPTFDSTSIGWVLASLPTSTKIGHSFDGWFTDAIGGTEVTTSTVFNSDSTIFAQWTINTYTITFNTQGGGAIDPQMITHGSMATLPAEPPTRPDFTFNGWFREIETVNAWDFDSDVITSDTTLYAKWVSNPTLLDSISGLHQQILALQNNTEKLHDSIGKLHQLLTDCNVALVETQCIASLRLDTINLQRNIINLQRDTINDLRQIIVEWIAITDDLLDTIVWLRQLLAEHEYNATNVIETQYIASLQVFPNPVMNQLNIIHDWQPGDVVELFDMTGRRVFSQRVAVETQCIASLQSRLVTFTIDMSLFPNGSYILRIGNRVARIVKQ